MTVNLEPIKAQLAKDIGGYICLHRDDMAALVSEVEHLRGERAAVLAYMRRAAWWDCDDCGFDGKKLMQAIELGLHRMGEGA